MKNITETMQRGDCFKLLAACFYEPDKQLFIEEQLGEKIEELLTFFTPDGVEAAQQLQDALKNVSQEQLSIDHAALFVGPFKLLAPPYGSVYLENNRAVMGNSTMTVAQYYQEAGLNVELKEPPDHIAIELEFMYYLCNREASVPREDNLDSARRYRQLQERFFLHAMKPWTGEFCDSIRKGTDNVFYTNLADCLDCFLVSCENIYGKALAEILPRDS